MLKNLPYIQYIIITYTADDFFEKHLFVNKTLKILNMNKYDITKV